ncbi:sensor histidine kinase [Sphaerotilus mobilis]|uniref:histidine kinase n=1 Tax=Sphaerotilus mobilis TaxID=47994 RepID=A0A4Q7LEY1_9BURK|nr:ATP-binding protein [Sphaerotilus mobilis]RZS52137.1 signal transduction histidine kinase [Sphaerotilus mobilis]
MTDRLRPALPALLLAVLMAGVLAWLWTAQGPQMVAVRTAQLTPDQQGRAAYGEPGVTVELPHFTVRSERREAASIAYALTLDGEAGSMLASTATSGAAGDVPRHAVLFTQVINGGDFYLNGHWIAGLPRSTAQDRYVWYRPLLIPLPPRLLNHDGRPDVLTVEQSTHEPYILVSPVLVGRTGDLAHVEGVIAFLSGTLAHASNLFCLVAGLFMIGAWVASPRERIFALAGAAMVLWGMLFTLALWSHVPMDMYRLWRTLLYAAEGGLIALMSMFVLSFAGEPMGRRSTRVFIGFAAVAPVVYLIGGSPTENLLDRLWTGPMLVVYVYASARLARLAIRPGQGAAKALLLQSVFCIVLAFHDYGVLTGFLVRLMPEAPGWHWYALAFEPIYLSHLGLPLLLLVVGYILLVQHQGSVEGVNNANAVLKRTLAEREAELAASYEEQRRLAQVEAARLERDRIYQDMHDGIGSRLITTLYSVRASTRGAMDIEAQLQACIDDMRLVLYAHQDEDSDIQSCVFDYCLKLEAQLEGSGLQLAYDIADGEPLLLAPEVRINVLRILQEAVTNCIKHAGASTLEVSLKIDTDELVLDVLDNGRGLSVRPERHAGGNGKGMPGLASRAAAIGGQCVVGNASPGTRVRLSLPLTRGHAEAHSPSNEEVST